MAHELSHQLRTTAALAPVGGHGPGDGPNPSVIGRVASRVGYLHGLLLTSRQKRFNLEVTGLLDALTAEVAAVRADLASLAAADRSLSETVTGQVDDLAGRTVRLSAEVEAVAAARGQEAVPYFRPGTLDPDIWVGVTERNEYRLPDRLSPTDVVIDVGGHVGGFSHACLTRGVGWVWAFEAMWANWCHARANLARFGDRARVFHKAVWRSDEVREQLFFSGSPDAANTGGGWVLGESGKPVETVPLDDVIDDLLAASGADRVRLLKLDCEGSEFPILLTSRRLHLVDEVVGEYHEEL